MKNLPLVYDALKDYGLDEEAEQIKSFFDIPEGNVVLRTPGVWYTGRYSEYRFDVRRNTLLIEVAVKDIINESQIKEK